MVRQSTPTESTKLFEDMKVPEAIEKVAIGDMPLETMRDYRLYNEAARAENKKLKICRHKIKPCPTELHPTERVTFNRNDQPSNPMPVYISDEMIHYDKKLIPGQQYDLPKYVVNHLQEKGRSVWKWVTKPDGSTETIMSHIEPRFSLNTVYSNYE